MLILSVNVYIIVNLGMKKQFRYEKTILGNKKTNIHHPACNKTPIDPHDRVKNEK